MPDLATLAPFLILLAVLVTWVNAFLASLILFYHRMEVDIRTAFIPADTALLNLLLTLLRVFIAAV